MNHKDELIRMQTELIRTMTEHNLKRMSSDFWGRTEVDLDALQKEFGSLTLHFSIISKKSFIEACFRLIFCQIFKSFTCAFVRFVV